MSEPFLGEIEIFGFNFAPVGWLQCNGQLLPISQYTALFSILGTTYGGNGQSTFALPNLQGIVPPRLRPGVGLSLYDLGETGGAATTTLLSNEIPLHNHTLPATATAGRISTPTSTTVLGSVTRGAPGVYTSSAPATNMAVGSVGVYGSSQSHNNMMPYLTLNYCIAINGIFPSRN